MLTRTEALRHAVTAVQTPALDSFALNIADEGAVSTKTVTKSDGSGVLWIAFVTLIDTGVTIDDPSGWDAALIDAVHDNDSNYKTKVWSRFLSGTTTNPQFAVSASTDEWGVALLAITGAASTSYIHKVEFTKNTSSADAVCPAVTTTVDNCLIIRGFTAHGIVSIEDDNYPAGTTGLFVRDVTTANNNRQTIGAAWEEQATAGDTGSATFSSVANSNDRIPFTIAVRP